MRSVLTLAVAVSLVATGLFATGCSSRRAFSRSTRAAQPARNVRLARRTMRATPRAFASRSASPRWIDVTPKAAVVETPGTVMVDGRETLDPCGIAGNEHMWVDITNRDGVQILPATYSLPTAAAADDFGMPPSVLPAAMPAAMPAVAPATVPGDCPGGICAVPALGECVGGNCGVPGACVDGKCGVPTAK